MLNLSSEEGGLGAPAAPVYSKASAQHILYIYFAGAVAESCPQAHMKTDMVPRLNLRQDSIPLFGQSTTTKGPAG